MAEPDVPPGSMTVVRTLLDDSHLARRVLRCKECGQLYFFEFHEIVDWVNGNDAQYATYVPVQETDLEALEASESPVLAACTPRIQRDWPSDAERPTVRWIRDE
jgi:hypothetical protein